MKTRPVATRITGAMLIVLVLLQSGIAESQPRPLLSEAIRKAIEAQGVAAAQQQFANQYVEHPDMYEVDMAAIGELGRQYAQAGNVEAASGVMLIAMPFMQGAMNQSAGGQAAAQQQADMQQAASTPQAAAANPGQGAARDDLERFAGIYGSPAEANKNRRLWVMVSCDGYLVAGALWGGAADWWMRSTGYKTFSYKDSFSHLNMEFQTDGSGKATRMIHDLEGLATPLERMGSIPADWGKCRERPKR